MTSITHVKQLQGKWPDPSAVSSISEAQGKAGALAFAADVKRRLANNVEKLIADWFLLDAFWRDQVALSWSLRTFHPTQSILDTVPKLLQQAQIKADSITCIEEQIQVIGLPTGIDVVRVPFILATSNPPTQCSFSAKLVLTKSGSFKIVTVTSALVSIDEIPWHNPVAPITGEEPQHPPKPLSSEVDVLIVGAGHSGLSLSAFLTALGINHAALDAAPTIGDSWAKRYDSVALHTTRVFSGLPFLPFPRDYPMYIGAKQLAAFYQHYAKRLQLPVYSDHKVETASFDKTTQTWTVHYAISKSESRQTISARHVVFAIGIVGRWPIRPTFEQEDQFLGPITHSSEYANASTYKGKKVAVVGSSTTACDIASDCVQEGVDVTMVQRGPTRIYPAAHIEALQTRFWSEEGGADLGDIITSEDPIALQWPLQDAALTELKDAHEPEYYEGLRRAGFLFENEGPLHQQIYCAGGRHYPDIGATELIRRGDIKIKSRSTIKCFDAHGIQFTDGSRIDADAIILATGFEKDFRPEMARIIGKEETGKVEPVWGLNVEGEVSGVWRPAGHDSVWVMGGELQTMRYCGRFMALQLAATVHDIRPSVCGPPSL